MSKIGHYLQEHLTGEVISATDARRHFATDASIFSLPPALVVYPQNENDVRKIARFSWQLAERNRIIPITARGSGSDVTGAAIGNGVMVVFPAHMNRIVEFESKSGSVTVEPGINYGTLQQTLMTHGRFLPPFPASLAYSTVGGAVANNASGEKSIKYGDTRAFVRSLRVVLANGEVIETGRLSKRELNKKLGLATFEGEIYRSLDALLEENIELVDKSDIFTTKNTAGYSLLDVKRKDGSFDLTPLFVGSQGTLGLISEITLDTETYNAETTLLVAHLDSAEAVQEAVLDLRKESNLPSAIELVDGSLLTAVEMLNPNLVKPLLEKPYPNFILLVEYDDSERVQKKAAKQAKRILERHGQNIEIELNLERQADLWKLRRLSASVLAHNEGTQKAVPLISDAAVPVDKLAEYITAVHEMLAHNKVQAAIWGHAGDANLHMQPYLDLGQVGDRQKAFKLLDEYAKLVTGLGGTISAERGDGRLRAPYLRQQYGEDVYGLFQKVKQIFDPYGTLNPGVKMNVSLEDIKPLVRSDYSLDHLYPYLPRS